MRQITVTVTSGLVRLTRKSQSFVLPIDEAPALVQELLHAVRHHTVTTQQQEMAGETQHV